MQPPTTLTELRIKYRSAVEKRDRDTIRQCAEEMDQLNTTEARAHALIVKAKLYQLKGEHEKSMELYEVAKEMFAPTDDVLGKGNVEEGIGKLHLFTGEFDNSLKHLRIAEELYRYVNSVHDIARILGEIGDTFYYMGDALTSIEYYNTALQLANTPELSMMRAGLLADLGASLTVIGDLAGALSYLQQAHEAEANAGNTYNAALINGKIGQVHHSAGDYDLAVEHYSKAMLALQNMKAFGEAANMKGNLGGVLLSADRADEAEKYLKEAIVESRELNRIKEVAYFTEKLCNVLMYMERTEEASILVSQNLTLIDTFPEPALRIKRIRAHIAMRNSEFTAARELFNEAIEIATARADMSNVYLLHEELRDMCKELGDFEGYIYHNEKYHEIYETLRGHEQQRKIAEQQKQHALETERKEHEKHLAVLHSTLPKHIADRVARGETVNDHFDNAAVMFLDIVGFTTLSSTLSSQQVTTLLDTVFEICDDACNQNNVTRIKTIGDSYMAVQMPNAERQMPDQMPNAERQMPHSIVGIANAALQIVDRIKEFDFKSVLPLPVPSISPSDSKVPSISSSPFNIYESLQVRIGLHCGPITAGVLGKERLQYDVWGDTVNVASRMESTGEPNRIQVSEQFAQSLRDVLSSAFQVPSSTMNMQKIEHANVIPRNEGIDDLEPGTWNLEPRGLIEVKGKGEMQTYWLDRAK